MNQDYVGIDLHRRRSVIVHIDERGEVVSETRIENDPVALALAIAKAGPNPDVALEATYGWYWAADVLEANGATVHLAHPLGVKAFSYQRVKKDATDAKALADLLRLGRLPEAWLPGREIVNSANSFAIGLGSLRSAVASRRRSTPFSPKRACGFR